MAQAVTIARLDVRSRKIRRATAEALSEAAINRASFCRWNSRVLLNAEILTFLTFAQIRPAKGTLQTPIK